MDKEENESLHNTKEVINLDELTESAINNIEHEVEQNMNEADLQFQEEIEQLHIPDSTMIIDENINDKKDNIFKKMKNKWHNMSKKNKIILVVGIIIVIILIAVLTFFLLRKKEVVIPDVPDVILEEDNYRYENGTLYFLEDDEEIGSYECINKDEKKCFVAYLNNDDEFDGLQQVDEETNEINLRSKIYNERFVFVFDNKNEDDEIIKLFDIENNEVKEEFLLVKAYDFIDDTVILKNMDSKYGLVTFDSEGVNTIIPYEYDKLGILNDDKELNKLVAKKDGSYYLINKSNEVLTNAMNEMIVDANKNHLKIKDSLGSYTVMDYHGKEIGKGDFALLLDDYVIFARESQLYVTDYDKHPMNLEGIILKNDQYNPIAHYKNNKLVKTEKSFDAQVYDKNLIITIYGENSDDLETITLNLKEGIFSSTLSYLNYLNGKLYFYSDEAKENLLGSYTCNNKNTIENTNASLNNCSIATESMLVENRANQKESDVTSSLGILPIFFNRYVFIKDGHETIVLYDLQASSDSSIKAYYTKVDARIYNKADKVNFANEGPYYYIAESERTGNYGLAKITKDNVEGKIGFDYKELKHLGDYYVGKTDDGYYLLDIGNKKLTLPKDGEILDYNGHYLKYLKDDKYYVSAFDKDSDQNEYEYVELYDNYYAAVIKKEDENKKINNYLSIYAYNAEEPVNSKLTNILLYNTNYTGDKIKAFNLTFNKDSVIVEIGDGKEKEYTKTTYSLTLDAKKPIKEDEEETKEEENNKEEDKQDSENEENKEEEQTDNNNESLE